MNVTPTVLVNKRETPSAAVVAAAVAVDDNGTDRLSGSTTNTVNISGVLACLPNSVTLKRAERDTANGRN